MSDKSGYARKVWLIPDEMVRRISDYQARLGVGSEVEAARRLLNFALQSTDTFDQIKDRLRQDFIENHDLRGAAARVLVGHPYIKAIVFNEQSLLVTMTDSEEFTFEAKESP